MFLGPGDRLGPYEIVSAIGSGGMGEVYRARDPRLWRDVAIKVIPLAFTSDPERLARFEQEARAAAALTHPNILAVHDIGTHGSAPYIVSELLEGETLRERLKGGALPVRKAIEHALQVAHGLAAAHAKGIIHRDLKPENVFLTSDGRVKILDFGLAKLTQGEPALADVSALPTTPRNTMPGLVLGTVGYMSPEQVRGLAADLRSDIFAFGAILHEMLSGQRAFRGETAADTMTAILKEERSDLPVTDRHTSLPLERIIDRCLEKNPTARFQSVSDLAFALEGLAAYSESAPVVTARKSLLNNTRLAWAITTLSLVVAGALSIPVFRYVRTAEPQIVITRLEMNTPPTSDAASFAISPNGQQMVYVANNGEQGSQLWLRPLDQVTAQALVGSENALYPFWSPDSRNVGFFADGKLKQIDIAGGTLRILANAGRTRGGTWNRDGVIVFASGNNTLMRVASTGGTPVPVTALKPGQTTHNWPRFLPDGHRFLFFVQGTPDTRGVYLASIDGAEPTRVLDAEMAAAYAPLGYLLTVSQGVLVAQKFDAASGVVSDESIPLARSVGVDSGNFRSAFSISEDVLAYRSGAAARRHLVWFTRAGKEVGALGAAEDSALSVPQLSPDGQLVAAYRVVQGNGDVWLIDANRGIASRFTFDAATDASAVWSPDGSRLVFRSTRNNGKSDLFEKPLNGGADEQPFLVTTQNKSAMDWSSDGKFLLYTTDDPKTQSDLWGLPLTGERKPFPVVQTGSDDVQGQFSPDGRWVSYASNETGRYEVYIRPFPGPGGKWQVSTTGGIYPRWRRDGRELFYVTLDNRLMAAPINVSPDSRTLTPDAPISLFATRLAISGNVGIGGYVSRAQYAVASDGRFLMNVAAEDTSPITIVQNWTAALKK